MSRARTAIAVLLGGLVAVSSVALQFPAAVGQTGAPTAIDGSFVVTVRPNVTGDPAGVAGDLVSRYGGHLTQVYAHALRGFALQATPDVVTALRQDPAVADVEPDLVVRTAHGKAADGQDVKRAAAPSSAVAPRSTAAPSAVRVFVVDTGIRFDHGDLGGRASFGFDAVGDGRNGVDCNGHGTAMAGAVGGARSGIGTDAALVSVRVLGCDGRGSLAQLLAGLDWVAGQTTGPAVVTLGTDGVASASLDSAVSSLLASGVPVVVGAGDEAGNACDRSPGRLTGVITVAAVDGANARATFSNVGPCTDLFAPGVDIVADDMVDPGATRKNSGTAIAAARVAGVVARILAGGPTTPAEVADAIIGHAATGAVTNAGSGTPDRLLDTAFLGEAPAPPSDGTTPDPTTTSPPSTTTPSAPTLPAPTTAPGPTTTAPPSSVAPSPADVVGEALPAGAGTNAFVLGLDGALWWRQLTSSGWSAWQSFGGQITGNAAAVQGPGSSVYVFARGADGALWWQRYDGTRWSGWNSLGGGLSADPAAVADSNGVWVFARGNDLAMYWGRFDAGGTWLGWQNSGGVLQSKPALAADSTGVYAFVRGADSGIWSQRVVPAGGQSWTSLGGAALGDIAAATDGNGSGVSVVVRGNDSGLYRRRLVAGVPQAWQSFGGVLTAAPAATPDGSGISTFVRGADQAVWWLRVTSGGPQTWSSLGGVVTADPAAATDANGITLYVRGNNYQLYARRYEGGWQGWASLTGVPMLSGPSALAASAITAAPPPPPTGRGFDACEAPSTSAMGTWRLASPYTSAGIYVGGENRACANGALNSNSWVNTVVAQGWRLIPIYVGLQAPCINFRSAQISRDLSTAAYQGFLNAQDAANRASNAGIAPGAAIYFDMEGYNNADAGCVNAVRSFMSAWVGQVRARGYKAGMYSSLCSGIVDQAAIYNNSAYNRLDAIWFAAWPYDDGNDPRYGSYDPQLFGTSGCGAGLTDSMWPFHQRIRQYRQGHDETYNDVTINIDTNNVDGPLAP